MYRGKGVLKAVNNVNTTIKEALVGNADVDGPWLGEARGCLPGQPVCSL